jgi:hypothetical protein
MIVAEVPAATPVIAPLLMLAGLLVAFGIIYVVRKFIQALLGGIAAALPSLPFVGNPAASLIHRAEQAVTGAMGDALAGIDNKIAMYWTQLRSVVIKIAHELPAISNAVLTIATLLAGAASPAQWRKWIHWLTARVEALPSTAKGILHTIVKPIQGEVSALDRWTRTNVRRIDHAIDHTIPGELKGLWGQTKTIEGEISRLWDAIRANDKVIATTAFVGAVAFALSRLDLGWLRCSNVRNVGKKVCGMNPKLLDSLLGLAGLLTIAFDFEAFVDAAEIVANGIGDAVAGIEGTVQLSLPPLPPPQD